MRIALWGLALVLASATVGCKTDTLPQGGGGSCATDLSGTWDVMATRLGSQSGTRTYVMTISANGFTFSDTGHSLNYVAGTTPLTWTSPGNVHQIAVSNTPAAVNTGSLPLSVGGSWTFTSQYEVCTASVAGNLVTGSCQGTGSPVGGADWPYPLPSPANGKTYSAIRAAALASQLGELGGQWNASGGLGHCAATIEGSGMTATCTQAQGLNGSLQLTLGSDCVASGTSGGFELSARRR